MADKQKVTVEEAEKIVSEISAEQEALYSGGPAQVNIDKWKEEFGQVYMTEMDEDEIFIWRVLSRKEFKELMKIDNADAMYREERMTETCVLWPEGYNFTTISTGKAGIPTVLAEQIMERSGFAPKTGPILL